MNQVDALSVSFPPRVSGHWLAPVLLLSGLVPLTVYGGFGGHFSVVAVREASTTLLLIAFQFLSVLGGVWLLLTAARFNGTSTLSVETGEDAARNTVGMTRAPGDALLMLELRALQWLFVTCGLLVPLNLLVML